MRPEALRAGSEVAGRDHDAKPADRRATVFLETLAGTGATTEVWRARSASGQTLAVKRFIPGSAQTSHARGLLEREALLLSRLADPGLVATHGVLAAGTVVEPDGRRSECPALALEYLGGGDLVGVAGSHPRHWILAAQSVLAAVAHLHAAGFAHGDIKASNVLFGADQRAKLIDLSSCMPLGSDCDGSLGTLSQQRMRTKGHRVSEDDDVFACAALVYELMAGRVPFADDAARAALRPSRLAPRSDGGARALEGLPDLVCGMLRSAPPLGRAELRGLSAALAAVERHITQD